MKTLIIPDIHERIIQAQSIINFEQHDHVIFTGDFFDSYDLPTNSSQKTAEWVKDKLYNDRYTVLTGNHDVSYMFCENSFQRQISYCSGFNEHRKYTINSILSREDWNKFKIATECNGVFLSHAGLSNGLFNFLKSIDNSFLKSNVDNIKGLVNELNTEWSKASDDMIKCVNGWHPFLWVGFYRGGRNPHGGLTWCDAREYSPLDSVVSVFGHTRNASNRNVFLSLRSRKKVDGRSYLYSPPIDTRDYSKMLLNGVGVGIDADLRSYATIEDDILTVYSVIYNNELQVESSKPVFKLNTKTLIEIKL